MSSPSNTKSRKKEYQKSLKSFLFNVHRAWGQKLVLAELCGETYRRNRIGSHVFAISLADTWYGYWPKERAPILYISQISDSSHTHLPVWVLHILWVLLSGEGMDFLRLSWVKKLVLWRHHPFIKNPKTLLSLISCSQSVYWMMVFSTEKLLGRK